MFNLLCVRVLVRLNTRMWYMYNCIAGGCTATSYSNTTHVLALFRLCSCRQKKKTDFCTPDDEMFYIYHLHNL